MLRYSRILIGYDIFKDRHTIDVNITKFSLLCFKIAESFENEDNILRDWE